MLKREMNESRDRESDLKNQIRKLKDEKLLIEREQNMHNGIRNDEAQKSLAESNNEIRRLEAELQKAVFKVPPRASIFDKKFFPQI